MKWHGYEVCNYMSEDEPEIVAVLRFLWRKDEESRREHFRWKHQKNPLLREPIGIVAKYEGKVVGFRGVVPTEWRIGSRTFRILMLCDGVVHPEHRRKGLFYAMNKAAMQLYRDEYRLFVATTANSVTTYANLKQGWKPLFPKKYLWHLSMSNLVVGGILGINRNILDSGTYGDISILQTSRPDYIVRIDSNSSYKKNRFSLDKKTDFVEWRLSSNHAKYTYFYHTGKSGVDAYVILSTIKWAIGNHARVIDYGEEEGSDGVKKLLNFIADVARFASISFLTAGISEDLKTFLRTKHFYAFDWILKKRKSYNLPILIRPVIENLKEDDWFINGLDLRDMNNWHITEICFY